MALLASVIPTWTPTATADATNLVDNSHQTIQGGSATQRGEMRQIFIEGQAGANAPTFWAFGRTSQVGSGALTQARVAAIDPSTAALAAPPAVYVATATNKPQRSATLGMLLGLTINAFGGILRWFMGPDEVISFLGNAASLGELSLNAFTGGTVGACMTTLTFEVK